MRTKHFFSLALVGLAAGPIAAGCSSDVEETIDGSGGSGTTTTTYTTGTTTGTGTPTTTTTTTTTDTNTDCASAIDYYEEADADGLVRGSIDYEGDADFFIVPLLAGEYWIFEASVPGLDEAGDDHDYAEWLDTVISLYSEDGSELAATIDDQFPRWDTNARFVYRAPADGTYCVKIEDWGSWAGVPRPVGENFEYDFGVFVPASVAGNVIDIETNDDAQSAQPMTFFDLDQTDSKLAFVYGGLDTQADVDVFSFEMPAGTAGIFVEDFTPRFGPGNPGTNGTDWVNGNGSTLELGPINVSNGAGTEIIAQLDASRGSNSLFVPLTAGESYLLWIQRKAGTSAGVNDFYDLQHLLVATGSMNQKETEDGEGQNDTAANAEIPAGSSVGDYTRYFIYGHVDSPTDVDMWRFAAGAGNEAGLSCSAVRSGSGLVDASFAIVATDGTTVLQQETETADADVYWSSHPMANASRPSVTISTAGNYYLSVSAADQSADVTGTYYICGVFVGQ